jgi:hypothetical protein
MTIADMILYLRQQLLTLRSENNRQAVAELLATFKMLTRAAFESGDKDLVAVLVNLTDSTRDLYMGKPLNGSLPTEAQIRSVASSVEGQVLFNLSDTAELDTVFVPETESIDSAEDDDKFDTQPLDPTVIDEVVSETDETPGRQAILRERLAAASAQDWHDHSVIRDGTPRQMRAYTTAYDALGLFHNLAVHNPVWVGSFPIGIDIESSDIEIACHPASLRGFITDVRDRFGSQDDFKLTWKAIKHTPTVIARFWNNGFWVRLVAQSKPVNEQDAYRYMRIMARLLALGGEESRQLIKELRAGGVGLAPAFVVYFGLAETDPHQSLLDIGELDDDILLMRMGSIRA